MLKPWTHEVKGEGDPPNLWDHVSTTTEDGMTTVRMRFDEDSDIVVAFTVAWSGDKRSWADVQRWAEHVADIVNGISFDDV